MDPQTIQAKDFTVEKLWQILERYLDTDETSVAASETATTELKGSY